MDISLQEIKEKYSEELAEEIEKHLSFWSNEGWPYRIYVLYENEIRSEICLASYAYTYIYYFSKLGKKVYSVSIIDRQNCEKILQIMREMKKAVSP